MKFIVMLFCLSLPFAAHAGDSKIDLQKLDPSRDQFGGCGCSVMSGDDIYMWNELESEASLLSRINGRQEVLRFVSSTEGHSQPKVGDRFKQTYKNADYDVVLNHRVTFVCRPEDEGCEVTRYSTRVDISKGQAKRSYKMKGDCGC